MLTCALAAALLRRETWSATRAWWVVTGELTSCCGTGAMAYTASKPTRAPPATAVATAQREAEWEVSRAVCMASTAEKRRARRTLHCHDGMRHMAEAL